LEDYAHQRSLERKTMKIVVALTAASLAAASFLVFGAAGERHDGKFAERLRTADANGDGLISRAEAASLPRLARQFDEIDANRDGQASQDELRAFHEKRRAEHGQRRAEHLKKMDADGDGRISRAEAQANAPRLFSHFDEIDANKDGFVTPDEMRAAHAAHRGHHPRGAK
jgi:hypothetical protein